MVLPAKPLELDKLFFKFLIELAVLRMFVAWTPDSLKQSDNTANEGATQTQEAGYLGRVDACLLGAEVMLYNSISMTPSPGHSSLIFSWTLASKAE